MPRARDYAEKRAGHNTLAPSANSVRPMKALSRQTKDELIHEGNRRGLELSGLRSQMIVAIEEYDAAH